MGLGRGKLISASILVATALSCAILLPAMAGPGPPPVEIYVAKKPPGPHEQTITSKVRPGKSKLFYFLVFTSPPEDTRLILNEIDKPGKRYSVRWFKGEGDDGNDVTDKITRNNGAVFANGGSESFTAKVTRKKAGGDGFCLSLIAEVDGASNAAFVGLDGESCTI